MQEPAADQLERRLRPPEAPLRVGPGPTDHSQGGPAAQVVPGRAPTDEQVRASPSFRPPLARPPTRRCADDPFPRRVVLSTQRVPDDLAVADAAAPAHHARRRAVDGARAGVAAGRAGADAGAVLAAAAPPQPHAGQRGQLREPERRRRRRARRRWDARRACAEEGAAGVGAPSILGEMLARLLGKWGGRGERGTARASTLTGHEQGSAYLVTAVSRIYSVPAPAYMRWKVHERDSLPSFCINAPQPLCPTTPCKYSCNADAKQKKSTEP